MPRPRRDVRDQLVSETQQRLLEAAAVEFAREGYVGANINRISQVAGYAKGTIYNYFPSKRALMLALIDQIAAEHVNSVLEQVGAEQDSARRIECFFRSGFAFVEQHSAQAQVIIGVTYGPDAEFKGRVYDAYEPLFSVLIRDIQAGIVQGTFRPVDPDLATALVMSIYLGSCSQLDADGRIWLDPAQVTAFILEGLRNPVSDDLP